MKQTLIISGEIPAKKNSYRYGPRGLYKPPAIVEFEQMIAEEIQVQRLKRMEGTLYASFIVYTATNWDLDNKVTTILDALQGGGLFDNDRQIIGIAASKLQCKKGEARTLVEILNCYSDFAPTLKVKWKNGTP